MEQTSAYKLKVSLPFLKRGGVYLFDDETGQVYAYDNKVRAEYGLRSSLSSYLWLLKTEGQKYLEPIALKGYITKWKTKGQ